MMKRQVRVIAVDGPSGAGKSSTSRRVGEATGFLHVDSGALYRIMTLKCVEGGVDVSDPAAVAAAAARTEIESRREGGRIAFLVDGEEPGDRIRTPAINASASRVSAVREVREKITSILRSLAEYGDIIVEGRDITTAVFPDTPARFFLTASPEARAARRQKEEADKGISTQSREEVKASLLERDRIDSTRKCAPLRKADGVVEIDSTGMTLDEVVAAVLAALPPEWRAGARGAK